MLTINPILDEPTPPLYRPRSMMKKQRNPKLAYEALKKKREEEKALNDKEKSVSTKKKDMLLDCINEELSKYERQNKIDEFLHAVPHLSDFDRFCKNLETKDFFEICERIRKHSGFNIYYFYKNIRKLTL